MAEENSVRLYIGSFLLAYTLIVSYPLFIYSWMQFHRYRKERFFQHRESTLVVIETVIMFISICIFIPLKVAHEDLCMLLPSSPLPIHIIETFDTCLIFAISIILSIKIWLVNYSHCLQLEIVNSSWKKQLETFKVEISESFYTKYQHSLGSSTWIIKYVAIIYIALCTVFFILEFVSSSTETFGHILLIIYYLIAILIITILWCKYPKFKDCYHIRDELKTCIIYGVSVIIFGVIVLFIIGLSGVPGITAIGSYVQVILFNGFCYIAILRNVRLNTTKIPTPIGLTVLGSSSQAVESPSDGTITAHFEHGHIEIGYKLQDVVNNEYGYEMFMNFLVELRILSIIFALGISTTLHYCFIYM